MKKNVFLVFLFALTTTLAFSQGNRFNLTLVNLNIKEVLTRIEEVSDYSFFYKDKELDLTREYNQNYIDATIIEVLRY